MSDLDARLPAATQALRSQLSLSIWEPTTRSTYNSETNKYVYFCKTFDRSFSEPTQADIISYACWLATVGAYAARSHLGIGTPMAYSSVLQYVQHAGRLLKTLHQSDPLYIAPTESLQTHWCLMAIKRTLGDQKQRARPISAAEIEFAVKNVKGLPEYVAAFRFLVLLAWLGAFRLGQLLPTTEDRSNLVMLFSHITLDPSREFLIVLSIRSKSNVFRTKTRRIKLWASSNRWLCIVTAYRTLLDLRQSARQKLDVPLSALASGLGSFARFVAAVQTLLPAVADTPLQKGHFTGHSFRRGFTMAALNAGISLDRIMIHGDWSHEDSVLNCYAVGTVLPSVCIVPVRAHMQQSVLQSSARDTFFNGTPVPLTVFASRAPTSRHLVSDQELRASERGAEQPQLKKRAIFALGDFNTRVPYKSTSNNP